METAAACPALSRPRIPLILRSFLTLGVLPLVVAGGCGKGAGGVEGFGHLGQSKTQSGDKVWECRLPYWQKGNRVLLLGVAASPAKPLGPVFLAIVRLPSHNESAFQGGVESNPAADVVQRVLQSVGHGPLIEYSVEKEPHRERFRIGDTDYSLEAGRVFLMDQMAKPPTVTQVQADLSATFSDDLGNPSKEELTEAIQRLRKEHETVDQFLAAMGET